MVATELVTLGILFFFAIVGGVIATRFRQPAVLGLLLVGAIIGPNSLNLVKDVGMIELMAEFGAILLLFVIGLEFSVSKVLKLGFKAMAVALFKVGIMFFIGYSTSVLLGLGVTTAMFIGVIVSFTGTVVVIKILEQKEMFKREEIPLLMAVLIIEDILAVITITFFSGMSAVGSTGLIDVFEHLAISMTIMVLVFLLVDKFADRVITWLMKNSGEEVITFIALGLCAGFAYLAYYLDLSPTVGAFLAGSVVASLKDAKSFEKAIIPYTLTFTSLFFIAIGTMVNFSAISTNLNIILILVVMVVVGSFIGNGLTTYVFANFKGNQVFFSSMAMFSVGEFSLLIAKESVKFNLGIDLVTVSSVIIFITAILMSLTVNYYNKLYMPFETFKPTIFQTKIKALSTYIKSFFEELDTESTFTKDFKVKFFNLLLFFMLFFFTLFGFRRLINFVASHNVQPIIIYSMIFAAVICISVLMALMYRKFKQLHSILVSILWNLDKGSNSKKTRSIINNLGLALTLVLIGLFSPAAVFIFKLPPYMSAIPLAIIIMGVFYLKKSFRLLGNYGSAGFNVPQYRKLNVKTMRFEE